MKVRLATTGDLRQFDCLWEELLMENQKNGDPILNDKSNRAIFRAAARSFMSDSKTGCVIMAFEGRVPVGVVMWGSPAAATVNTVLGKAAHGWGSYVRPKYRGEGLSREMREMARAHLLAQGFKALFGSVLPSNLPGVHSALNFGFAAVSSNIVLDLERKT